MAASWWEFPNLTAANNAANRVSSNMGIPVSPTAITRRWAVPMATADTTFAFVEPAADRRGGVVGQTVKARPNWAADPGMGN